MSKNLTKSKGVPREIIEFYGRSGGQSILLRGNAGAGKTIFAVRLLKELSETQKSMYLTTKALDERLMQQFSWLEKNIGDRILDASRSWRGISDAFEASGVRSAMQRGSRAQAQGNGHEAQRAVHEVSRNQVSKLLAAAHLPELEMLYEKVESNLPNRTLIVIDTVEGLSSRYKYDGTPLSSAEIISTIQRDLVEGSSTNALFILGGIGDVGLDYIVDGVISFSIRDVDGRRIRELSVDKLRTVEIKQPRYVYSLINGEYNYFEPFSVKKILAPGMWGALPDADDYFSTGSEDMDGVLGGGYRKGSYNIIEVDDAVSHDGIMSVVLPTVCNFIRQKRGVMMIPEQGNSPEYMKKAFLPFIGDEYAEKYLRILVSRTASADRAFVVTDAKSPKERARIWEATYSKLREGTSQQPILDFTSFSTLEYEVGGNTAVKEIGEGIKQVKDAGDLGIGLLRPGLTISQEVKNMSDFYLRLTEINGSLILYGIKPKTQRYNIYLDTERGFPELCLTRIS